MVEKRYVPTHAIEVFAMNTFYQVQNWFIQMLNETWAWFSTLSNVEWMVVLGICSAFGFLCMRGIANRGTL
ncbi:hypothetical protein [Bythopirellula polymerisocia]|uniref:Uncharacterized protein n=1 Tax=Bythopirellula polymerisocia TaxID=2528003 RepID=A0A5C6CWK2_9BACT|nr:hypothetical protein [Bythopirellula polymerisocia]TWU27366.1 hypothetical protein Pla144_21380 [Bythopirellula polymerisocia]